MNTKLICAFLVFLLPSLADLAGQEQTPLREYIVSSLERMRERDENFRGGSIETIGQRLRHLRHLLPEEDVVFKDRIDQGLAALRLMTDDLDDSGLRDVSLLGVEFARYYRKHYEEIEGSPTSELAKAFFQMVNGVPDYHDPPPYFFSELLDGHFHQYLHFYNLPGRETGIPEHVKDAMMDSLEWATLQVELKEAPEGAIHFILEDYARLMPDQMRRKVTELDDKQRQVLFAEMEFVLKEKIREEGNAEASAKFRKYLDDLKTSYSKSGAGRQSAGDQTRIADRADRASPPTGSSVLAAIAKEGAKEPSGLARSAPKPESMEASPKPWRIIVVLIVAATGLLWLLVKNRK